LRDVTPPRLGRTQFHAILALSFFIMFGYGLVVPTMPLFASQFPGVAEAKIGLLLTTFAGARLFADFFAGALIDRYGDRIMAAIGAGIVGISSASAGTAQSFNQLLALRGFGGIGSAFFLGALMSHLIGSVPPSERGRSMSLFQGSIGAGFVLGPAFGGLIGAWLGLRAPLFIYGTICIVAVPLCLAILGGEEVRPSDALADAPALPEEPVPPARVPAWQRLRPLLGDSAYRAAIGVGLTGFFVAASLDTLVSRYWHYKLLQSMQSVGIPFTIFGILALGPVWHAGKLADRRGRKFATVPAMAITAVFVSLLGFAGSPLMLIALMGATGIASAYQRPGPSAIIGDVAPPDARGVAVSGLRVATDIGAFIGPVTVGFITQHFGFKAGFLTVGIVSAVAAVMMLSARETAPALAETSRGLVTSPEASQP
jgi:MFS family permease